MNAIANVIFLMMLVLAIAFIKILKPGRCRRAERREGVETARREDGENESRPDSRA
jgi:hypothetical protein